MAWAPRLRRVTAGAFVCLAAAGCVTPHQRSQTETLPDCQRLVATPGPPPPSAKPSSSEPQPSLSSQPQPSLDTAQSFQLLAAKLDTSGIPKEVDPPEAVPVDPVDPRLQAYFQAIKRRIETVWVYPQEAIRRSQSGKGVVEFGATRDGRLGHSKIVQSTGAEILDRYMLSAIRFAAPFPPHPCKVAEEAIRFTLSFTYVLGKQ